MSESLLSLREGCLAILECGDLEAKLRPLGQRRDDLGSGRAIAVDRPARDAELRMQGGARPLPRPRELSDPDARAMCLRRFAHHELMAVELFAWALLLWPDAPPGLRQAWVRTLSDEQRHCRLYLDRLHALGARLGEEPLSDYFWRQAPAIRGHPRGPLAFLAAMGLTLEQANLDFTLLYRDAFRRAGDEESAQVSQAVHDDEQRHVGLAARWLGALSPAGESLLDAYRASVPFPLEATRAKGRVFHADARRAAGLPPDFIDHVRRAGSRRRRSSPEGNTS